MTNEAPALVRAPLVEVACGVRFKPIPAFDTLRHGLYWSRIRDRYTQTEVHSLLAPPGSRIMSDVPLQRSWFVSSDSQFVVQVQVDRFVVNWRKRGPDYPRFADRGVYERFERELDGFRVFMRDVLDVVPEIEAFELTKVDILNRPADWVDREDLGRMIPRLRSVVSGTGPLNFNVALAQPVEGDGGLNIAYRTIAGPKGPRVQADFRLAGPVRDAETLAATFDQANIQLNNAFFRELPDAEQRFGTGLQ